MKFTKHTFFFTLPIVAATLLFSCSKDDDENKKLDLSVTVEDGRIAFKVSGCENASMEGDKDYSLSNNHNIKYLIISVAEDIVCNDVIWCIRFGQNPTDGIALPEQGEYPLVQGEANTYDQSSFNATISAWMNTMT